MQCTIVSVSTPEKHTLESVSLIEVDSHMEYSEELYPPQRARIKSPIWGRFFGFPKNEQGDIVDDEYPICKACSRKVKTKGGNTSNLFVHLREHHPPLHAELKIHCFKLKRAYARRRSLGHASREFGNEGEGSSHEMMALPRFRKHKFTNEELDVLIAEVTNQEDVLFGQGNPLTTREKYRIWFTIAERVSAASGLQRSMNDVKRRWQDLKRRTKQRVVEVRRNLNLDSPSPSSSSLLLPYEEKSPCDLTNSHIVVKEEEQNSTACSLPDEIFLNTIAVSPEACPLSVEPRQSAVDDAPEDLSDLSFPAVPHSLPTQSSTIPISHPQIKEEVQISCLLGNRTEITRGKESHTSLPLTSPYSGLRVSLPARTTPSRPSSMSPFEQQMLRAHREHTVAIREGFRSLARQNRLLYLEVCETNKNMARIASRMAERVAGAADVAEELVGIQHRISESIDATNSLQGRVVDLLASQQERPVIILPQAGTNSRPAASAVEGANVLYRANQ